MTHSADISIPIGDAVMGSYLAGVEGLRPGIVILHEIFGANVAMRAEADQLAAEGFIVSVPDLFHRIAPGTALTYEDRDRPTALALWEQLDRDPDQVLDDISVAVDHLAAHPACDGNVVVVGFCLGGKLALLLGAKRPLTGIVSFYPVQMQVHRAAMQAIRCPVQVQLGETDTHVPGDVIDVIREDIAHGEQGEVIVHEGAGHGFYNPVRTIGFHAAAAADARRDMLTFIRQSLGQS
jgi:carboxymethylenebutenolidase